MFTANCTGGRVKSGKGGGAVASMRSREREVPVDGGGKKSSLVVTTSGFAADDPYTVCGYLHLFAAICTLSLHLSNILNPNGIASSSPGLRASELPWVHVPEPPTPNGVAPLLVELEVRAGQTSFRPWLLIGRTGGGRLTRVPPTRRPFHPAKATKSYQA